MSDKVCATCRWFYPGFVPDSSKPERKERLSTRSWQCCVRGMRSEGYENHEITTKAMMDWVRTQTDRDLLEIKGLGETSLCEIRKWGGEEKPLAMGLCLYGRQAFKKLPDMFCHRHEPAVCWPEDETNRSPLNNSLS